jgi:hypothetical protein
MMVDYYLVRRGRVVIDDLYQPDPSGSYYYRRGVNPRALWVFVPIAISRRRCRAVAAAGARRAVLLVHRGRARGARVLARHAWPSQPRSWRDRASSQPRSCGGGIRERRCGQRTPRSFRRGDGSLPLRGGNGGREKLRCRPLTSRAYHRGRDGSWKGRKVSQKSLVKGHNSGLLG